VQVGDLVQQRHDPQGTWLVTRVSPDDGWFMAHGFGTTNTWLLIREYKVIVTKE